jgi:hypothetical protein
MPSWLHSPGRAHHTGLVADAQLLEGGEGLVVAMAQLAVEAASSSEQGVVARLVVLTRQQQCRGVVGPKRNGSGLHMGQQVQHVDAGTPAAH